MPYGPRFTRLSSSAVLFQIHVSEDSLYALIPIIEEKKASIKCWKILDTTVGAFIGEEHYTKLFRARNWVIENRYDKEGKHLDDDTESE